MGIGFMRMDSDAGPDIRLAFGDGDDGIPLALAGRNVEEARHTDSTRVFKHLRLALQQAFVIEVAVAVDQLHASSSSSSSSGSSSRGNKGSGAAIAPEARPPSMYSSSLD